MIVVLDCNVWITLALNSQLRHITGLSNKRIKIASCNELRNEIADVLSHPKFKKVLSEAQVIKVIELHDSETIGFKISKIVKITSDPKDDYLFALSSKSKANYLVTGDKLLLNVGKYKKTEIISLSQFKEVAAL